MRGDLGGRLIRIPLRDKLPKKELKTVRQERGSFARRGARDEMEVVIRARSKYSCRLRPCHGMSLKL